MTDWELIFNMLGEKATTDITKTRDAQGLDENKQAAQRGGQIAHHARKELEQKTGQPVVTPENNLENKTKKIKIRPQKSDIEESLK